MSTRWKWVAGGVLVVAAVVAVLVAMSTSSAPPKREARWDVVDIAAHGAPLRGEPIDLIAVGNGYVGLVRTKAGDRFVTSPDGLRWNTVEPTGLPVGSIKPATYPGGLSAVDHVLFSDGDSVFARVVTGSTFKTLGSVSLYESNADARTWSPVKLPAPAGTVAFPIATASANGRRYIVGSVYKPAYGRDYLSAAVWISRDRQPWHRVDSPVFSGKQNTTMFALDVAGNTIVAGGGDGSLRANTQCCYFDYGAAFWLSVDGGEHWVRAAARDRPYGALDGAAVVGFVHDGAAMQADVAGRPARSAESSDQGATWTVTVRARTKGGVFPRAGRVLHIDGRYLATTTHGASCTDCTEGALALSEDGLHWRGVTPAFPCGTEVRTEYGFISRPVVVGTSLAVLAACGKPFGSFNETLLGTSTDRGSHWRITRYGRPTGDPLPAVAGHERIVTLAGASGNARHRLNGPVRAVVVHTK